MRELFLAARALFFVLLLPGTVACYVPFLILRSTNHFRTPALSISTVAASALAIVGTAILSRCVWDFFSKGSGTLAPVDPPRQLVVSGLYRYTRNPMYNGVLAILIGEALFFGSSALFVYALCILASFHLMVLLYEEPALTAQFRGSYEAYRRSVPRWGFTIHPYRREAQSGG